MSAQLPAQTPGETPDTVAPPRVIPGETLRRAGVTRLSDVLVLAHRWDVETVDGFTWRTSALGGGTFTPARWTVLVDGRRVDDDLFGRTSLDRLAVPLEQIASVELVDLPRLAGGEITSGGLVHIRTVEPPDGPAAGGWFVTGSEIGDPGPFAFTPRATSNVDRLGHTASADLSYGGGAWFARAAMGWARLVPTDPAILSRYIAALGRVPRIRSTGPMLRIGGRLGGGRHEVVLRHSRVDGALALSPFGTEIATDERFTTAGIAGDVPLGGRRRLMYDLSHTRNGARLQAGRPGPPLDWSTGVIEARMELTRPGSTLEVGGVRLRRRAVGTPEDLANPEIALATGYAGLRLGRGRQAMTAGGTVTIGEGDVGVAVLLAREWQVTPVAALEVVVSYERTSRGEDNSIWAWTRRGYDLLEESGADVAVVGAPRSPQHLGGDLVLTAHVAPAVRLSARGLFRRSRGLSLERRELHFVSAISSFEGPTAIVHGAGGELAGASLELAARPAPGLVTRASYWVRGTVGGDRVFRENWSAVPRHGARTTMEYSPVAGLDLWLAAGYRGSTRHPELTAVESESDGRYRARVGAAVTLDAAIQKRLWNGRLRTHFGVRNVLGADLRYHPTGATFGPTAVLQLEAALP